MCHTSFQLPTNDITWLVFRCVMADVFYRAVACEIYHQVGHTPVVDIFIRPRQTPVVGVFTEVSLHVFMHFFLQVYTQLSVSPDYHICTNTFIGRHIAIWVVEAKIGRVVLHLLIGKCIGRVSQLSIEIDLR